MVLDVVIMERDVCILSTVETDNTYTPARWLALERACHRLNSLVFISVSFIHCSSSRSGKVFVSSSRFVLRLTTVQALCNLPRVVLELHRLDEIGVPLEVSLSTQLTTLHFLMMCFNTDLPSWRLVLEFFPS